MKLIIAFSACLLISGAAFAQTSAKPATKSTGTRKPQRTAIGGVIKDARWQPVPKIQAFIYKNDTIIASGFSNATGSYETNSVLPGIYALRLVYPSSGRRITVTGIPVKALKVTPVNLTCNEPTVDSTIAYTDLVPKTEVKKK